MAGKPGSAFSPSGAHASYMVALKARQRRRWIADMGLAALVLAIVVWLAVRGASSGGYNWQWYRVWPYFFKFTDSGFEFGILIKKGLTGTLWISFCALLISLACGLVITVLRLLGGKFSRAVCTVYVEGFRNLPLMVLIIAFYAVIPAPWGLSAESIVILVIGLFEGAYIAEVFRAGIEAVPKGQWEAAASLGLSPGRTLVHIILPQALRHCLPPLVSQCISLVKDSSLAGVIAVTELTQQGNMVITDTFLSFEVWLPLAAIYLLLAFILSGIAFWLEKRLSKGIAAGHEENTESLT